MRGRWRATGCGILRYRRHSALGSLGIHGVHAHIETVAQIAKVLLQRSLSGFTALKAIRLPRRLAHGPPAFKAVAMVRHDLKHVDYRHTVSLCCAAWSFSRSNGKSSMRVLRELHNSLTLYPLLYQKSKFLNGQRLFAEAFPYVLPGGLPLRWGW